MHPHLHGVTGITAPWVKSMVGNDPNHHIAFDKQLSFLLFQKQENTDYTSVY